MNVLLLLLAILIPPFLLRFWWRRRGQPGRVEASEGAAGVRPTQVMLPDEEGQEEDRPARHRSGEEQELRRRVVHGPYRPIGDRGAPTDVEKGRQS